MKEHLPEIVVIQSTTTKKESAVKTGDNTNNALYAGLGGAAIIALGLLAYRSKKAN